MNITLAHGNGGRLMHELIGVFRAKFSNSILDEAADAAEFRIEGKRFAFTTDSYVVKPIFFPGGDIGKLAVCGTVNDLVMQGAVPEYLTLSLIIEEGLDYGILKEVIHSLSRTAKSSRVHIVTGDLKVVEKGACDKMFINTSGIGRIISSKKLSVKNIEAGDRIILSGNIGQHGLAVLTKRKGLDLEFNIKSDCAALNALIIPVLKKTQGIKFMRDPTRGGVATTLNEITEASGLGAVIEEKSIPISAKVRAAAELLGIDPLYIGNEGIAILVVEKNSAGKVLSLLRRHALGRRAEIVGEVVRQPKGQVILNTSIGTQRIVDMLTSEPLPRIC